MIMDEFFHAQKLIKREVVRLINLRLADGLAPEYFRITAACSGNRLRGPILPGREFLNGEHDPEIMMGWVSHFGGPIVRCVVTGINHKPQKYEGSSIIVMLRRCSICHQYLSTWPGWTMWRIGHAE